MGELGAEKEDQHLGVMAGGEFGVFGLKSFFDGHGAAEGVFGEGLKLADVFGRQQY